MITHEELVNLRPGNIVLATIKKEPRMIERIKIHTYYWNEDVTQNVEFIIVRDKTGKQYTWNKNCREIIKEIVDVNNMLCKSCIVKSTCDKSKHALMCFVGRDVYQDWKLVQEKENI